MPSIDLDIVPAEELEKADDMTIEAESISEAISFGALDELHDTAQTSDLEKSLTRNSVSRYEPATRVETAQDWTGPDDSGNPQNWSGRKKAGHFLPIAFLAFSVTVGSSLISPANEDLQKSFHVSRTAAIVPLTVFVVGLGLGPLIAAPLSEKYGRSVLYKISAPVYILFLVGAGTTKTFGGLVVCRLLAGLAGAPVLAIGAGSNADLFAPKDRAATSAAFISSPFLGPTLGPIIGGFAVQFHGWRWTVWCNIIIAGVGFLVVLPMHETYKRVILRKRARQNNLAPPPGPEVASWEYWRALVSTTLIRPMQMLITEPIVLHFAIYNAFAFCVNFAFYPAYPYTCGGIYGFNTWQSGLAFSGIGLGVVLAFFTVILIDRSVYQKMHREAMQRGQSFVPPEHRLYAGMLGAIGLPIGLFWFAWSARPNVHWISPVLAGIPFGWGNLCLFISATLYQIDVYGPLNGASAMAANGLLRYVAGGCFPLFTVQMYEALGIDWATSLLGFICVAMLPIPFAFYRYGPAIRARSGYETMKD